MQTRDQGTILVLQLREGERPTAPEELPTSNIVFYCDDLPRTYEGLRGVDFPQPPVQESRGWWSMSKTRKAIDSHSGRGRRRDRDGGARRARVAQLTVCHRRIAVGGWIALTVFGVFATAQLSNRWPEQFSIPVTIDPRGGRS